MAAVEELYHNTIAGLPPADRLHLATLILNGLPTPCAVDESDEWSDEDLADLSPSTRQRWPAIVAAMAGATTEPGG